MEEKEKKEEIIRRLRIIEGHLKRVRKMVEEGRYCIDVIQQSLAVQSALKKVDELVLENHLRSCVAEAKGKKREEKLEEILELFRKRR
jgi:DNA-binding FrmR family transcriptional regulator